MQAMANRPSRDCFSGLEPSCLVENIRNMVRQEGSRGPHLPFVEVRFLEIFQLTFRTSLMASSMRSVSTIPESGNVLDTRTTGSFEQLRSLRQEFECILQSLEICRVSSE